MKKSELKQLIKEEIKSIIKEINNNVEIVDFMYENGEIWAAFENDEDWRLIDTDDFNRWLDDKFDLSGFMEDNSNEDGPSSIINWEDVYSKVLTRNNTLIKDYINSELGGDFTSLEKAQ